MDVLLFVEERNKDFVHEICQENIVHRHPLQKLFKSLETSLHEFLVYVVLLFVIGLENEDAYLKDRLKFVLEGRL